MNILKKTINILAPSLKTNKSRTVRYAFPLIFTAIALLGAQAIVSENHTYITIEPSTNSLRAGESFYFNVYVTASVEINAVDLAIAFPDSQVEVTSVDTGESVITLWTADPYIEGNTVYLRGGTFRRGFIGEHLVATVNARAVSTGIADITIADSLLLAGDGSGTEVSINDASNEEAKIYIASEDGTYVPTDSSSGVELTGTVEVKIVTDIDGDGDVSLADVSKFMAAWRNKKVMFDFNGDGKMTFRDFGIILSDSFFK